MSKLGKKSIHIVKKLFHMLNLRFTSLILYLHSTKHLKDRQLKPGRVFSIKFVLLEQSKIKSISIIRPK